MTVSDENPKRPPVDSRPFLVIPYWPPGTLDTSDPGDTGERRPLPDDEPKVVWYLCPAIRTTPYEPGTDLTVHVDVLNRGGANTESLAHVSVWWTDPASAFVIDPANLIGFDLVPVKPRGGRATSRGMTKRIPDTAPKHVCLLVRVSHQYDPAGNVPDPVGDRHWAQRNLTAVSVSDGQPIDVKFVAANPLEDTAEFTLSVRQNGEEHSEVLAQELGAEPRFIEASIAIGETDEDLDRRQVSLQVALRPGERRPVRVRIDVLGQLEAGTFASYEISQRAGERGPVLGSLGVVALG
ncbi:hypothetical protein [Streptomyces avermitilis]|uniref:hypothetical protein n=1 Tax=Streptomyces avermitilis TaxID=33903 RepID=UPI0033E4C5BE